MLLTMTKNQKLVYIALLAAQAVVIGLVERAIPFPFAFAPGAKLGLANLVTLLAIYTLPFKDSAMVVVIRLVLNTLLGGTLSTFMIGFSGALFSYFGMLLVKNLGGSKVSTIGVSTAGGILHNIGQLVAVSLLYHSWTAMVYLPVISFVGVFSGFAIGICATFLMERIQILRQFKAEQMTKQKEIKS